jgi:TonB family protein
MRHPHQIAPRARATNRPWYRPAEWCPLCVALAVSVAVHVSGLILLHRGRSAEIPIFAVALYAGDPGGNGVGAGASGAGDARASGAADGDAGAAGVPAPDPADRDGSSAAVPPRPEPARKSPPQAKPVPRAIARSEVERDPAPARPGRRDVGKSAQRAGSVPNPSAASSPPDAGLAAGAGVSTARRGAGGAGTGRGGRGAGGGASGDLRGNCLACPVPAYPRQARRHGWQGFVDLRLRLDGTGKVAAITVERSSGHKVLDDAAVAAARRSRFRILSSVNVSNAWGRMRYRFEIDSG